MMKPSQRYAKEMIPSGEAYSKEEAIVEMRQSESRSIIRDEWYKYIIHTATEGFFVTDLQFNIIDVNDAFCRMEGYSRQELLSMGIKDLDVACINSPEVFSTLLLHSQSIMEGRGCPLGFVNIRHRRKDGKVIDVEGTAKFLDILGGVIFHFNRDITEQKELHRQLKESEERYRTLIELGDRVGEAVIMLQDANGKVGTHIFVSDKWCDITGYSREELLNMSFFDLLHPRYRRDSIERHGRKMNGDNIPDHFVMSIIRNGGAEVPIEVTSAYSKYQGERVNVAYIRDISELKRIEENLKQYQSNLERLVEERTVELERANKNLINMGQSKAEFIQAIIHELKTPITPIQAASEILIAELPDSPLKDLAQQIHQGAQNLNLRIDELRDVAKSERGYLTIDRKTLDLEQLLRNTIAYIEPVARSKNLSLALNISDKLPVIRADYDRICQVLLNLISNAIKFTQEGGSITIQALREKDEVVVEVQDTGCGLSKAALQHIFEPYHKPNIKKQSDGLGLGLALSKMLVELHGGKIYVDSQKNKGSSFKFTLPLSSEP